MEYIPTHQKTESSQIQQDNDRYRVPNKDAPNTNGQHQAHQNQLAKCPNSTLCSQSSLSIRHMCQKQLAKCPDSTLCSKEKCAWVHT